MSRQIAPLPPELRSVFTWRDASLHGVSSRRLLQADVERVLRGVYRRMDRAPSPPPRLHPAALAVWRHGERAKAVASYLPRSQFFVGRTAAALWGLPVTLSDGDPLEVGAFAQLRASSDAQVAGVTVRPHLARVVRLRGAPVTDAATTWAMLAARLSFEDGVALGDAVIRHPRIAGTQRYDRAPHATLDELAEMLEVPFRQGRPRLREMLPLLVTQSASPPESHLRLRLQEWNAPTPELDHDVFDTHGLFIGCSEFAYPTLRLALEYEGEHHRTDTRQWNRDIEKYRHYQQAGWESLRVTSDMLYARRLELRSQIFEAISRRAAQLGQAWPVSSWPKR